MLLCFIPLQNGPTDWLLVDEHLVDLSGNECNKVGVSFSGFRNQIGKCFQHQNSYVGAGINYNQLF